MSISITDGTTTLALNPALYWVEEQDWSPVAQSVSRGLTGALLVSLGTMVAGRPITLEPEDDKSGWTTRADIAQMRNWAAVAGQELTITLRGQNYSVIFRHQDTGITATPVVHFEDVEDGDYYRATFRFMTV